jgi:hydroxypyruvate isomerase
MDSPNLKLQMDLFHLQQLTVNGSRKMEILPPSTSPITDVLLILNYCRELDSPNLKLQMDLFHLQQLTGNVSRQMETL